MATVVACLAGCGTTRWTDTARTATEQLLLSDAIDRAVGQIDVSPLAGKDVYFDAQYLTAIADQQYLTSTLRQHLLAQGCVLKETRADATYVVEARAGAVGTNRHEMLFGVPQVNLPTFAAGSPYALPSSIPEIGLLKDTQQAGVAKIALFAFNRQTGRPVWQSGINPVTSTAKAAWVLGAGPFQRGTIYDGTKFAGGELNLPLMSPSPSTTDEPASRPPLDVTSEAVFPESRAQPKSATGVPVDFQAEAPRPLPQSPVTQVPVPTPGGR